MVPPTLFDWTASRSALVWTSQKCHGGQCGAPLEVGDVSVGGLLPVSCVRKDSKSWWRHKSMSSPFAKAWRGRKSSIEPFFGQGPPMRFNGVQSATEVASCKVRTSNSVPASTQLRCQTHERRVSVHCSARPGAWRYRSSRPLPGPESIYP